jgi:glycosyltransferase involved in cell wall biosynthesis
MRILYLNPCGNIGGGEAALLTAIGSLSALRPGWSLEMMIAEDGPLARAARQAGASVHLLPFPEPLSRMGDSSLGGAGLGTVAKHALKLAGNGALLAGYLFQLRQLIGRRQPNIVHTNGLKMHALGAFAAGRRPTLVWHLQDYLSNRPLMRRALSVLAHKPQCILGVSESVAGDIRSVLPKNTNVSCMYNGISTERYAPDGPALDLDACSNLPRSQGAFRVGLVATFAHWKGHRTYLEALALLRDRIPVRAYVIGGAVYRTADSQHSQEELETLAASLGLQGHVGFTGFVDNTEQAIRSLDVVVHASTRPEPFGLVIAEAMACERAVIISRAGGATELIEDEVTGLASPPGDPRALAAAIERLYRQPELRRQMGVAGRLRVLQKFDSSVMGERLAGIYEAVAHASSSRQ